MMGKKHSISEARVRLPRLVREAESGKAIELTRRGESVAVLIGRNAYDRLVSPSRQFSEAWDKFAGEIDLMALQIDPDEVFAGARDSAPGRDTEL
jgi:prevent-host-death family protein